MFCDKCGGLLVRKKEGNQVILVCSNCGASAKSTKISEKGKENKKKEVGIIKGGGEVHPIESAECPKCGHGKAYAWMVQTRAADEAPTRFYKCVKCGHTWREYD